jgi:cell division septation protein DedD
VIELERHIEILLLSNDCVIVPDFGGFMAHHIDACYDDTDNMFIPPKRTLGFNPQLKMNDSLLVQSYIEAYDISYPEASKRIECETNELKQNLDTNGFYNLNDIGTLYLNDNGNMEFKPCEAGILTPELYGLGNFEIDKVSIEEEEQEEQVLIPIDTTEVVAEREADIKEPSPVYDEDDDSKGITIPIHIVRYAVAAVAAIVFFFAFTTPIANSEMNGISLSGIKNSALFNILNQKCEVKAPGTIKLKTDKCNADKEKKNDTSISPSKDTTEQDAEDRLDNNKQDYYSIVLASKVSKSNAESYVKEMHKAGYEDTKVYVHHHTVRVIYGCYSSESEAYNQLNKLRDKSDDFKESWIYKVKG